MCAKRKIRAEFRKGHQGKPRRGDLTRDLARDDRTEDRLVSSERVSGKGELTRKRTIVGQDGDEGSGLSQLNPDGCSEFVKLLDGSKVNGPISSVTLDAVTCAGQSIPCSRIASISSARVFKFTTKIGESPRMTFQPSCVKLAGASKTYEAPTWKKIVIVGACVTALACAITLPIVIPLATRGGNHHNDLQNAYIYNTYLNASRVQPPPQPVRSGSGP